MGGASWGVMAYVLDRRLDSLRQALAQNGVSFSFTARHASAAPGRARCV